MQVSAIGAQPIKPGMRGFEEQKQNQAFGATQYVIVPAEIKKDTFIGWAGKNIAAASAFSVVWDLGNNLASKFFKSVEPITIKQMLHNIPKVAGIFLLIGGIFKAINGLFNK
ncbi:MAG: hypothetical protein PHX18_03895 [Candidatus Gastranaerophilales bacterium]|nr:hypothetical protein [Candidatus Gastranaerophilales bacterium]